MTITRDLRDERRKRWFDNSFHDEGEKNASARCFVFRILALQTDDDTMICGGRKLQRIRRDQF